jgi:transposase
MFQTVWSEAELDRVLLLKQAKEGFLTQGDAAKRLGISERQVRRLLRRVTLIGIEGIKSKHKGGNRAFTESFKALVLQTVCERYFDFGPTFAAEKLQACEGLKVNRETLRQWMVGAGIWKGRARKQARIHQSRERRSRFGELVQIDGSHHDWFEGRAPKCCLLVFIDDATSKIIGMRFEPAETTFGYMRLIKEHVQTYGRPLAYYSDKHSIFKTTRAKCTDRILQPTQLHRALKELQIELICAYSSEAKGRVERVNQTMQDRLVKELRLAGISGIEAANAFVPTFLEHHNPRFSVQPAHPEDAHRPLHHRAEVLHRVLSVQTTRKLSKNLEFSLDGDLYQITTQGTGYRLRHSAVTICEHMDDRTEVLLNNEPLAFKVLPKQSNRPKQADCKDLGPMMDQIVLSLMQSTARVSQGVHAAL